MSNEFKSPSLERYSRPSPTPALRADWVMSRVDTPSPFVEYWRAIRSNPLWIIVLTVCGLAAGWVFAAVQRPLFEAQTVLDIRSLNENFLNSGQGSSAGATATESVLPEAYIQTEIKILQSDSVRKRAMDQLSAGVPPDPTKVTAGIWATVAAWFTRPQASMKDLIVDAGRRVKVHAIGNTRIVEVLCDARDGQLAAAMCNTVSKTYIAYNLESRVESTKETSDWLQSQLDDVRRRLTKAENDLKDAGKTSEMGIAPEGLESPVQERLRQLQTELSRTQTERIVKEANFRVASSRGADALPPDMDAGPIREYRLKLAEMRRQLSEMLVTMTPEHYRVRELKMQIAEVEKAIQDERTGLLNRLQSDMDAAMRRESMISAAYNQESSMVSRRDDLAVRYNMVKHEVDSERRLYETLLQKVGEVGLAAAMRTSTISIVDPAVAPLNPYSPNMLMSLGVGLFGGSALGLVFCVVRTRSDRTLRSPGDATLHLQLRELGVIPSIGSRKLRLPTRSSHATTTAAGNPIGLAQSSPATKLEATILRRMPSRSIALATWLRDPEVSEAFFGTMHSLVFASPDRTDRSARVIVTTSPEAGDGKTTVATNLAIALAQVGRRVVLVDGDLRKPRLHAIFDVPADRGLMAILDSNEPVVDQPLTDIVCETGIPNLYLVPTKPAHGNITAKLHSSRMRALVLRLRNEFDVVIIDSPPMQQLSDARVLGWLADGVLLVFRARKTSKEAALAVHDCLTQDGIRVLGTVLNDWDPRKSERYSSGYSAYSHLAS